MINIIVPIVENVDKFEEFVKKVNSKDAKVFVGIRENLAAKFNVKSKNVEVHVYNSKSNKEEIINSLHSCNMEKGKILIVRRPLKDEEFLSLTKSTKEIVTLKANKNKFSSAIKNFMSKVVMKFFGFSYFEDISAIYYGETMFDLLSVCSNLSMASRINKYVGVEFEEVTTLEKPVRRDYSRPKNIFNLLLGILFFLGSLAGGICVCIFGPLKVLIVILVIAWLIIALVLMFISIINFTRTVAVGKLRYGRAEEI